MVLENKSLIYFRDYKSALTGKKGTAIPLEGRHVEIDQDKSVSKYGFCIVATASAGDDMKFRMYAKDDAERSKWLKALHFSTM